MTRCYCDVCGVELAAVRIPAVRDEADSPAGSNNGRHVVCEVQGKYGKCKVEVRGSVRGEDDGGDICKYCVIDALKQFDDRKPMEGSIAR